MNWKRLRLREANEAELFGVVQEETCWISVAEYHSYLIPVDNESRYNGRILLCGQEQRKKPQPSKRVSDNECIHMFGHLTLCAKLGNSHASDATGVTT